MRGLGVVAGLLALVFMLGASPRTGGRGLHYWAWGQNAHGIVALNSSTYVQMDLALVEAADAGDLFSIPASFDEICFDGPGPAVVGVQGAFVLNDQGGDATDVQFRFGIDTTGAIDDGDEVGETYTVDFQLADEGQALAMNGVFTLASADCLGVLGQINTGTTASAVLIGTSLVLTVY